MKKILSLLSIGSIAATNTLPAIENTTIENKTQNKDWIFPFIGASADMTLFGSIGYRNVYSKVASWYWSDFGLRNYDEFLDKYSKAEFNLGGSYLEAIFMRKPYSRSATTYTGGTSYVFEQTNDWRAIKYVNGLDKSEPGGRKWFRASTKIETRTTNRGIDIRVNVYVEGENGTIYDYVKGYIGINNIILS